MKVKIYALYNNNELIYIGKTSQKLEERLRIHKKDSKLRNSKISNYLKKYNNIQIEIIEEVEYNDWEFWEEFYINYFKCIGCNLLNTLKGGITIPSFKNKLHTVQSKLLISKNNSKPRINKSNFGINRKVPILQFTIDNVFIKEHKSALDAFLETGINKESIRNCCNSRSKTAGGYKWSYKH